MAKDSQQVQFLKIKDFVDSMTIMAKHLLKDVPKSIDILEQSLETDSSDAGSAIVTFLKAVKEGENNY